MEMHDGRPEQVLARIDRPRITPRPKQASPSRTGRNASLGACHFYATYLRPPLSKLQVWPMQTQNPTGIVRDRSVSTGSASASRRAAMDGVSRQRQPVPSRPRHRLQSRLRLLAPQPGGSVYCIVREGDCKTFTRAARVSSPGGQMCMTTNCATFLFNGCTSLYPLGESNSVPATPLMAESRDRFSCPS